MARNRRMPPARSLSVLFHAPVPIPTLFTVNHVIPPFCRTLQGNGNSVAGDVNGASPGPAFPWAGHMAAYQVTRSRAWGEKSFARHHGGGNAGPRAARRSRPFPAPCRHASGHRDRGGPGGLFLPQACPFMLTIYSHKRICQYNNQVSRPAQAIKKARGGTPGPCVSRTRIRISQAIR